MLGGRDDGFPGPGVGNASTSPRPDEGSGAGGRLIAPPRPAAADEGADVAQEGERDDEPLEAGHVAGADVPHDRVGERRPREDEEPDERQEPAVERARQDVAEDRDDDDRQAWRDECEQDGQARHGDTRYGSTRNSAIWVAEPSNSISKMPSIVALKLIGVVTPALTSFLMS